METIVLAQAISNEAEYERAIVTLGELLDAGAARESHPFADRLEALSEMISAYESLHYPQQDVSPSAMVQFLLDQHDLALSELPEIGNADVVTAVLNGSRKLNEEQISALSIRFNLPGSAFT
jgi:HTH-type transcriptional regulator/antitoxin HigA